MAAYDELARFAPQGATHCVIEERMHRGDTVFAVVAIVPDGASVPINGYSSLVLAEQTRDGINAKLLERINA